MVWLRKRASHGALGLAAFLMLGMAAAAQEAPAAGNGKETENEALAKHRLEELTRAAARYQIVHESAGDLVLRPGPALRWSNPLRKTEDGAVFLWLAGGRPEVIASFYRYGPKGELQEDHEFQSLATGALTMRLDGRTVWAPRAPGLTLMPVPDAPIPAATAPERLRQMRALAREFHAFFDGETDKTELRLLTQPLYRYESKGREVLDGALFAFVQTTDPEVLLAIEERPGPGGAPAWHYGFARMSMVFLKAKHKDRDVWRADWAHDLDSPAQPYVTLPAVLPSH